MRGLTWLCSIVLLALYGCKNGCVQVQLLFVMPPCVPRCEAVHVTVPAGMLAYYNPHVPRCRFDHRTARSQGLRTWASSMKTTNSSASAAPSQLFCQARAEIAAHAAYFMHVPFPSMLGQAEAWAFCHDSWTPCPHSRMPTLATGPPRRPDRTHAHPLSTSYEHITACARRYSTLWAAHAA